MLSTENTPILPAMSTPFSESLIGKLPAELLENVFLESVNDSLTASERLDRNCGGFGGTSNNQAVSNDLAFRTVCTAFRDLSWRAFAKKIEHTVFDLPSRNSIENLGAIARTPELASWITRLNIACHVTSTKYPYPTTPETNFQQEVTGLSESVRAELLQIKKDEQSWYPDTWSLWSSEMECDSEYEYFEIDLSRHCSREKAFEKMLARHLSRFRNIDHLCYIYDSTMQLGRYHNLVNPRLDREFKDGSRHFESWGSKLYAHLGLDVTITACAFSNIRPRVLELCVNLDQHLSIITAVPEDLLSAACNRVECLRLLDRFNPFFISSPLARIVITKENFPSLRSLTIDRQDHEPFPDVCLAPLPSLTNVPAITNLVLNGLCQHDPAILAFVARYGQLLENVTLEGVPGDIYDEMLDVLRQFRLKKLRIKHLHDGYWDEHSRFEYNMTIKGLLPDLKEDRIKSVAEEIILEPDWLVKALEHFEDYGSIS